MKKNIVVALLVTILCGCQRVNDDDDGNSVSVTDRDFVSKAFTESNDEIDMGQLAFARSEREQIADFSERVVAEDNIAQSQLKELTDSLHLNIAISPDPEHIALRAQLNSLTGHSLDSLYIHSQVKNYQYTIALFEDEMYIGDNSALKKYARSQTQRLLESLQQAQTIAENY